MVMWTCSSFMVIVYEDIIVGTDWPIRMIDTELLEPIELQKNPQI